MVQPVSITAVVPGVDWELVESWEGGVNWIPAGWATNPVFNAVRADRTAVNSSGTPQAFALSLADVVHFSTETGPFPNPAQRTAARRSWWWQRTPSASSGAWVVGGGVLFGQLHGNNSTNDSNQNGGVRPAIIVHQ